MSLQLRLRLTTILGSIVLVTPFAAGLAGFDPVLWIVFWAVFALWFLGVQAPGGETPMPLAAALTAQGAVVALLMGLGHAAGLWADAVLPAWLLIAVAVGALLLGRLIRVPPEELAELVRVSQEAAGSLGDATEPDTPPDPEPKPDPEPEPEPEAGIDPAQQREALAALAERLDALDRSAPGYHALVEAITPALEPAGAEAVAEALFRRADAAPVRDRLALVALMADPHASHVLRGEKLAARIFDVIAAEDCEAALALWAMKADGLLDLVPGVAADFPAPDRIDRVADRYVIEDADLCEALEALAARLRSGDGAET